MQYNVCISWITFLRELTNQATNHARWHLSSRGCPSLCPGRFGRSGRFGPCPNCPWSWALPAKTLGVEPWCGNFPLDSKSLVVSWGIGRWELHGIAAIWMMQSAV